MEILKRDHFLMKTLEPVQFLILSEISRVFLLLLKVFRKKSLTLPLRYIRMHVIPNFPLQILVNYILRNLDTYFCLSNKYIATNIYLSFKCGYNTDL